MKKLILLAAILLALPMMAKENVVRKNFKTGEFNAISTSSGWDVILTQGNTFSVQAEAQQSLMDNLSITLKGKTLYIKNKKNQKFNFTLRDVRKRIYITLPNLVSVSASGGSDVKATSAFKVRDIIFNLSGGSDLEDFVLDCNNVEFLLSGGSDAEVSFVGVNSIIAKASGGSDISLKNVKANSVSVSLSGGSDAELKGSTNSLNIVAAGGSDADASDCVAQTCKATLSGASDADLRVEKELNVSASGASDVTYRGNPALTKSVDKSSSVTRK